MVVAHLKKHENQHLLCNLYKLFFINQEASCRSCPPLHFFSQHIGPVPETAASPFAEQPESSSCQQSNSPEQRREKKTHPVLLLMRMTFTQEWMAASPRPPTDRQTDRQDRQLSDIPKTDPLQTGFDRIVTSTSSSRMSVSVFSSSHMLGLVRPKSPWTNSLM